MLEALSKDCEWDWIDFACCLVSCSWHMNRRESRDQRARVHNWRDKWVPEIVRVTSSFNVPQECWYFQVQIGNQETKSERGSYTRGCSLGTSDSLTVEHLHLTVFNLAHPCPPKEVGCGKAWSSSMNNNQCQCPEHLLEEVERPEFLTNPPQDLSYREGQTAKKGCQPISSSWWGYRAGGDGRTRLPCRVLETWPSWGRMNWGCLLSPCLWG